MIGVHYSRQFLQCLLSFMWHLTCVLFFILTYVVAAAVFSLLSILWVKLHLHFLNDLGVVFAVAGCIVLVNIDIVFMDHFLKWVYEPHEFLWVQRLFALTTNDLINLISELR